MKKKTSFSLILILVVFILLLHLSVTSAYSNNYYNDDSKTLIFLGDKKIAPILYEEKGIAKGVVVDITRALSNKIGAKIEIKAIEWEEAQNKVLSGDADALLQINPNPEREKLYDFSNELLKSEFSIFVKSGNTDINTINNMQEKKVGVEAGGYPFRLLSNYEGINIVIIPDWKSGFQMIKSGEIDAIVVDRWIGEYELAQSKVTGIQVVEEPIETSYSRIAVKKGNEQLLNSINAGLKTLNEDGTMADILSYWRGKRVVYLTEEYINRIYLNTFIAILIVILLISVYWINRFRKLNLKLESDVRERTRELHDTNRRLQKANNKLEKFSMLDGLTNISNRRFFDNTFQKAWNISLRERMPLALIILDIDYFKSYNDTYGHLAGDQCLKKNSRGNKKYCEKSWRSCGTFWWRGICSFII